MKSVVLAPLPLLLVLALAFSSALPWGELASDVGSGLDLAVTRLLPIEEAVGFAVSLLPIAAVYYWSVRRPRLLPAAAVFGAGLMLDVLTRAPLGVWPAAAVAVALAGRLTRRGGAKLGWLERGARVAFALAGATAIVGVLEMTSTWQLVSPWPLVVALALAILSYPLLAALLSLVDRLWPAPTDRPLFLRGD